MNDQVILDIQKHNNKITRILNKICEKHPALTEQIDLALYSCLKIQKIIKKQQQQSKNNTQRDKQYTVQNGDSNIYLTEEDQLYQNALNIIEGFKGATKKLENKVGILLREQQIMKQVQRAKYHNGMQAYYEAPRPEISSKNGTIKAKKKYISVYQNTSPFSPHIIQSSNGKSKKQHYISSDSKNKSERDKHKKRVQQYMNESQSFDQLIQANKSKNISQLDQEIIELASQIKHIIKRQ